MMSRSMGMNGTNEFHSLHKQMHIQHVILNKTLSAQAYAYMDNLGRIMTKTEFIELAVNNLVNSPHIINCIVKGLASMNNIELFPKQDPKYDLIQIAMTAINKELNIDKEGVVVHYE